MHILASKLPQKEFIVMVPQLPTVSIGISVHQKNSSIDTLLSWCLQLPEEECIVTEIIVFSSKPRSKVYQIKDPRIRLLRKAPRFHQKDSLSSFFRKASGQILLHIDAQAEITSSNSILSLLKPFLKDPSVSVVGGRIIPRNPSGFTEGALGNYVHSRVALEHLFDPSRYAYSLSPAFFAIRKTLAKTISFPKRIERVGEYIYLFLKQKGESVVYSRQAQIALPFPTSWKSALKFVRMQHKGYRQLHSYIPDVTALSLDFGIVVQVAFLELITNPIGLSYRLCLSFVSYLQELEAHERRRMVISERNARISRTSYRPLARI